MNLGRGWYFLTAVGRALTLTVLCASSMPAVSGSKETSHGGGHWGYSGSEGPQFWGELAQGYALCSSGQRQSPVDIQRPREASLYPLRFDYRSLPLQLLNNGHTLQLNYYEPDTNHRVEIAGKQQIIKTKKQYRSQLMLGDEPYSLLQLHFHTPSEHAIAGSRALMEVHLVHKNAGGNLAVVGVMLQEGASNTELEKILNNAPSELNSEKLLERVSVNASAWLPDDRDYYHYSGSLTTPPCSENVNWLVMKNPLQVSAAQMRRFESLIGQNARPLQPMHWRQMLGSR